LRDAHEVWIGLVEVKAEQAPERTDGELVLSDEIIGLSKQGTNGRLSGTFYVFETDDD